MGKNWEMFVKGGYFWTKLFFKPICKEWYESWNTCNLALVALLYHSLTNQCDHDPYYFWNFRITSTIRQNNNECFSYFSVIYLCPWKKNCIQYLIWKLSLVFLNIFLKMGMAAHLHSSIPTWRVLTLLHKQAKWRFIVKVAVHISNKTSVVFDI